MQRTEDLQRFEMDVYKPPQPIALDNTIPPRRGLPPPMIPTDLLFDNLNHALHGLGISCIVGGIGYATDSQFTYRHTVEWVTRLCMGDSDAILVALLSLSVAFGSFLP